MEDEFREQLSGLNRVFMGFHDVCRHILETPIMEDKFKEQLSGLNRVFMVCAGTSLRLQ